MTGSGDGTGSGLRTLPVPAGRAPLATRGGLVVHGAHRLGDLVRRRPAGITGNQWGSAIRESYDLVVADADGRLQLAAEIGPEPGAGQRAERTKTAVAGAAGLPVLRIGSATLTAAEHGRTVVGYVLDAAAYAERVAGIEPGDDPPVGFRDIPGRLPDGRTGPVNDLGALARAGAVEAYVEGRLVDPILRGLHVRWTGGPAEGWAWVEVRPGGFLVERVTVAEHRFSAGLDPARFAEDLAALAVGARLRTPEPGGPTLVDRAVLRTRIRGLAARRDEMVAGFAFDHLCAD
ncbi:hypothetical protein [Micromonospora endolithica]|uniref:DUF2726 domain-containing protein n=1 Tax=Micromonospora endolithica TaxID=230091 RepID=A0A3A9YXP1_9ACTN|nr:hypothetical protein [Micromonospora endolithica]RKN40640.1 hypothetical protein D7223_26270 [Micromonospora endolithica]TWJ21730.1 hypothetical protein JD76_01841 [Micromonospora endolithica]